MSCAPSLNGFCNAATQGRAPERGCHRGTGNAGARRAKERASVDGRARPAIAAVRPKCALTKFVDGTADGSFEDLVRESERADGDELNAVAARARLLCDSYLDLVRIGEAAFRAEYDWRHREQPA